MELKAGAGGSGAILVTGVGSRLDVPRLPLVTPVTVRLVRDDAPVCWESRFSTATVARRHTFIATGD